MPSIESLAIDGPARDAVAVVNLIESDAGGHHHLFHLGGVPDGSLGIEVERLDEDAATPAGQSRSHKGTRVVNREQASLECDAAREEEFTEVNDAGFSLIDGCQGGQVRPCVDNAQTLFGIPDNRC